MTTEAGKRLVTTPTGRALFTDVEPMDMWESDGVTPEEIAAIEQEARATADAGIERLRAALDLIHTIDCPLGYLGACIVAKPANEGGWCPSCIARAALAKEPTR